MANKLNEGSEFTIPLKNLIALIVFTGVAVWGYFGITERLTFIEHNQDLMIVEIEENDTWIDDWAPPSSVQQTTKDVQQLKTQLELLRLELEYLKATVYK
tara:strand:- start:1899 stop:2198 length:300 start_codon:yes stop_codon:yes gene_type:complete